MTAHQTTTPLPGIRRAYRDTDASVLGGVAAGLARHLGVPVLAVRAFFVVTAVLSGLGVVLYAGLWIFLRAAPPVEHSTPGGEAAARGGRRPARISRFIDKGPALALVALGFGALLLVEMALGQGAVLWPVVLGVVGIALLWRQADQAQRERWLDRRGRLDPIRMVFGSGGWASYGRVAAGVLLVVGAFALFTVRGGSAEDAGDLTLAFLVGILGIAVVVGPWIHRLVTDLSAEREERVRTQERADVAAHLHDSVLQTLALIQRSADDPATVARLARAQERDLRSWLYDAPGSAEESFTIALRAAAADIEDDHGVVVDVVVVGDAPLGSTTTPVVAAAREAMTNAAKHAGTGRVDVYAEIRPDALDVFVRDRGAGFDVALVPGDRHGVRDSIMGRMERHGGEATIRSRPGEGTEVHLHQPLEQPAHQSEGATDE
ncbi:PspC domain-containing protein [Nocardioides cheoyonin]|uniref:PspC domain-containing protein n=1 Tax=Nocardioides cheoyonin TaxID=3156615 RepID=UPI0032B581AB